MVLIGRTVWLVYFEWHCEYIVHWDEAQRKKLYSVSHHIHEIKNPV